MSENNTPRDVMLLVAMVCALAIIIVIIIDARRAMGELINPTCKQVEEGIVELQREMLKPSATKVDVERAMLTLEVLQRWWVRLECDKAGGARG